MIFYRAEWADALRHAGRPAEPRRVDRVQGQSPFQRKGRDRPAGCLRGVLDQA
jgi:hypothetical protein